MKNPEEIQEWYANSKGYECFQDLIEADLNALDFHVSKVQKLYAYAVLDIISPESDLQKVKGEQIEDGRSKAYKRIIK